jgi:beta-lactamase superfamily II metal-dependent hydrolase
MSYDYIRLDTASLYRGATGGAKILDLLWGDRVEVLTTSGPRRRVKARGRTGYVKRTALGGRALLEVYFIDVGQGDGVLIVTPDRRHVLIDGGYNRAKQPTGKNAADFVDWKFAKDYGAARIELDAMIASHCDADHYGGLWDLLNPAETHELDLTDVRVDAFYHVGVSWWKGPSGRWLGPKGSRDGEQFLKQLLGARTSVERALRDGADPALQGEWAKFLRCVVDARRRDGQPCDIQRLSTSDRYLPGFEPGGSDTTLKVLAPVEFRVDHRPAVRSFGGTSQNSNGNSVLLRLDYGAARILLTGDLNKKSQMALRSDYAGQRLEFQCDVAKSCHHGSRDISYCFLQDMAPAVTVISSGDCEGHDHPRPNIVAASATTGHLEVVNDEMVSPLVYSTELARSLNLGRPVGLSAPNGDEGTLGFPEEQLGAVKVDLEVTKAGDLRPSRRQRRLGNSLVVAGVIYGLVNVRTDGRKIVCATMDEKDYTWNLHTLMSRF